MPGPMNTVLFVETNSAGNGTEAMLAAQTAGYRTHFLTCNPAEYAQHQPNPLLVADEVSHVDTFDVTKMLRVIDGRNDYAAVLAYDELRVVQATLLGNYLGLTHNPPVEAMLRLRFKDRMRHALAGSNWSVRHLSLPLGDISPSTPPMPFPFVIKPLDEAAGVGVRICRDSRSLATAIDELRDITAHANSRGYRRLREVLIEELLEGDEYSAELVWSARRGEWVLLGFTAKIMSPEPCCVEVGYVFPHHFGDGIDERITSELRHCLGHLGLRDTMVHAEFRYSGGRIGLIEMNPRPAGGAIPQLVNLVTGTGLVDLHLATHLGNADRALAELTLNGYAGALFVLPEKAGRVVRLNPALQDIGGITSFHESRLPRFVDGGTSNEDRLGHIVVHAPTRDEVERVMREAQRCVKPQYEDSAQANGQVAASVAPRL